MPSLFTLSLDTNHNFVTLSTAVPLGTCTTPVPILMHVLYPKVLNTKGQVHSPAFFFLPSLLQVPFIFYAPVCPVSVTTHPKLLFPVVSFTHISAGLLLL